MLSAAWPDVAAVRVNVGDEAGGAPWPLGPSAASLRGACDVIRAQPGWGRMVTDPLSEAVPNELRDFADRSVEQAKKAFDGFIGVVNAAIAGQEPRPAEPTATAAAHLSCLASRLRRAQCAGRIRIRS